MDRRQITTMFRFTILLLGAVFFFDQMTAFCVAAEKKPKVPVFSLDVKNVALGKALKHIEDVTFYKINVDEAWQNEPVTVELKDSPLTSGLSHVLKNAQCRNYAILFNERQRCIRVIILGNAVPRGHKTVTKPEAQEWDPKTKEGIVTPPSSSGNPGLTQEELDAILVSHLTLSENEIVTPPSSKGSRGLTLRELKALEEEQMDSSEDAIATPPSSDGSAGLTLLELKQVIEQPKMISYDTVISPPSSDGSRGLTLLELRMLEEQEKMVSEDTVISPPSADGSPGLRLGDL